MSLRGVVAAFLATSGPLALLTVAAGPADATVTFCSNLAREGVRARMTVPLGPDGAAGLERRLLEVRHSYLGMSAGRVESEDPYRQPPLLARNLILQSPEVSVAIDVRTSNLTSNADIAVTRTCYSDAHEEWRPYWYRLRRLLRAWGYRLER